MQNQSMNVSQDRNNIVEQNDDMDQNLPVDSKYHRQLLIFRAKELAGEILCENK